jgi:S-adenosylmethionine synthetase
MAPVPAVGRAGRYHPSVAERRGRPKKGHRMRHVDYVFTSESVAEGHPDKICDRISDTILDAYLTVDPRSRVAAETLATTNHIVIAGEVRGPAEITSERIEQLARDVVRKIGYEQDGFHWAKAKVEILLHAQSPDIAQGVDAIGNKDEGAGDQGIMFGFACTETPELMPAPIQLAHTILRKMAAARHAGEAPYFGPDAKSRPRCASWSGRSCWTPWRRAGCAPRTNSTSIRPASS